MNRIYVGSLACLLLTSCTARTPDNLARVPVDTGSSGSSQSATVPLGERFDAQAEEDVSKDSLKAWRTAVGHAHKKDDQPQAEWLKQRATDEKEAMAILQEAAQRHPHSSTIYFMMGQVEDHFGKHAEAAQLYGKSREKNVMNPMTLFKLAESERQLGKLDQAEDHYQELLKVQPGFYAAKLGLAQCLVKKDPIAAKRLAEEVVAEKPPDPDAIKDAQKIVSELKGVK